MSAESRRTSPSSTRHCTSSSAGERTDTGPSVIMPRRSRRGSGQRIGSGPAADGRGAAHLGTSVVPKARRDARAVGPESAPVALHLRRASAPVCRASDLLLDVVGGAGLGVVLGGPEHVASSPALKTDTVRNGRWEFDSPALLFARDHGGAAGLTSVSYALRPGSSPGSATTPCALRLPVAVTCLMSRRARGSTPPHGTQGRREYPIPPNSSTSTTMISSSVNMACCYPDPSSASHLVEGTVLIRRHSDVRFVGRGP